MDWNDLRNRLQATLPDLTDRCYLIVGASDDGGYVQFAVCEDVLSAEASGPEFVAGPATHTTEDPTMLAAGWVAPTRAQPNWSFELGLPAMTSELAGMADRCVVALRDVLHVADPAVLTYRAWREAEVQPPGVTWQPERFDELDPGADPLLLPGLGLPLSA